MGRKLGRRDMLLKWFDGLVAAGDAFDAVVDLGRLPALSFCPPYNEGFVELAKRIAEAYCLKVRYALFEPELMGAYEVWQVYRGIVNFDWDVCHGTVLVCDRRMGSAICTILCVEQVREAVMENGGAGE